MYLSSTSFLTLKINPASRILLTTWQYMLTQNGRGDDYLRKIAGTPLHVRAVFPELNSMGLTRIGRRHLLRALRLAYSFAEFCESPHYTPSRGKVIKAGIQRYLNRDAFLPYPFEASYALPPMAEII